MEKLSNLPKISQLKTGRATLNPQFKSPESVPSTLCSKKDIPTEEKEKLRYRAGEATRLCPRAGMQWGGV